MAEDSAERGPDGEIATAWRAMTSPPVFLHAPLGLFAQPPGVHPDPALAAFARDRVTAGR